MAAKISAIDQEEDAGIDAGLLKEAVDEIDGGEGLSGAGGHLDEGTAAPGAERLFQVLDGGELRLPELASRERWEFLQQLGEGLGLLHPTQKGLGPVKGEDIAATRIGIELIGKPRFRAGALVGERERRMPMRDAEGHADDVVRGLLLDAGQRVALRFGLDGANGFAVRKQCVVRLAGFEAELADGDAALRGKVKIPFRLHSPATRRQKDIDFLASELLRGHR